MLMLNLFLNTLYFKFLIGGDQHFFLMRQMGLYPQSCTIAGLDLKTGLLAKVGGSIMAGIMASPDPLSGA